MFCIDLLAFTHYDVVVILWLFYCYMGAPYEVFVIVHLLSRTLIHQKAFSGIN